MLQGSRLRPKRIYTAKHKSSHRINIINTHDPEKCFQFQQQLEDAFTDTPENCTVNEKWGQIKETLYKTAVGVYGTVDHKSQDWFAANIHTLQPLIDKKKIALLRNKGRTTRNTLSELKQARKDVQKAARQCANDYWIKLCESIQNASDKGNIRSMYEGIKKACGPVIKRSAPLKTLTGEIITDKKQQMDRWVEHYLELY